MIRLLLLSLVAGCVSQSPAPGKTTPPGGGDTATAQTPAPPPPETPAPGETTATSESAQRPEANPTVVHAAAVLDSLLALRRPTQLSARDAAVWTEQLTWFKSLRARLETLLTQVAAAAEVTTPLPVDPKHIQALQEEAQKESERFPALSPALKARHDAVMEAIRSMK